MMLVVRASWLSYLSQMASFAVCILSLFARSYFPSKAVNFYPPTRVHGLSKDG
jgi:hypothetical protein